MKPRASHDDALDALQQLRLGVEEQVVREHHAHRDREELQREAAAFARVAINLLEQDQPEQRAAGRR